ncbi:hypothetical protein LTR10_016235 [Elasticomyces elasticus]|uniref:DUF1275 domain protein n=1 Tax=Exophiala sideris TaxID=1016849 RepID=A0ABR0JN60_9EURO|nr:hypothetical protein LTR10_016235 [Elasticomyces elasticus]KAK5037933.1 hypothetical protein LTS07_001400 [Exophiala sideris]KAK5043916.1 hypothetical protein LTR13_000270 [Exophiala sideris]KAK5067415.1 hypothetical protein LTR69_001402 [Exophiala sideris]KAK5182748.1 hypothetical protein LTR44_005139 [Eurotiomycetes sp. CCFEE 6388]
MAAPQALVNANANEHSTMEPEKDFPQSLPLLTRLRLRFTRDIDSKWGDLVLLGCFYTTGMVDAVAFNTWNCFVGMQTGNTVFAGLGVSHLPDNVPRYTWTKSLVAILSFCVGAFFFSRWHRTFGPLKRWVIMSSFFIQMSFMIITASLISARVVGKSEETADEGTNDGMSDFPWHELCPIALLAFQSAGQIVAGRMLKYNALPTVVLTSLFCDLMSNPDLFTAGLLQDPDRNRRATGAVLLFAGATVSGALIKTSVGYSGALWIATGLKGVMVLAWLVWSPKKSPQGQR